VSAKDTEIGPPLTQAGTIQRVEWLDGVRALAAIFVVLHHSWLMTVGGYPGNNGPWFTNWLVYGHLAVSVFIVVSGYSLALAPMRHGMRFKDGGTGFLRRRFWRIVPPYWAALGLVSVLIGSGLTDPANGSVFAPRDFGVHFFLLQDAIGNVSPNGAFWSIAVEWHIYFLYPLILMLLRRWGLLTVLLVVAAVVVAQHLLGALVPAVAALDRFTPAYLLLFVLGLAAACLVHRERAAKAGLGTFVVLFSGVVALAVFTGPVAVTEAYFWVDLTVGTAVAGVFVALDQGRLPTMVRLLSLRPLVFVGTFAFSLYLIHAPVLAMLTTYVVKPAGLDSMPSLGLLLALGCPAAIGAAYLFFLVFERPFLSIRSLGQLLAALTLAFRKAIRSVAPALRHPNSGTWDANGRTK